MEDEMRELVFQPRLTCLQSNALQYFFLLSTSLQSGWRRKMEVHVVLFKQSFALNTNRLVCWCGRVVDQEGRAKFRTLAYGS